MNRWDIINTIIKKKNYYSYLEVGTSNFLNYNQIIINNKECIDPQIQYYGKYTYNMTSDEAFKIIIQNKKKYDIIFIDGLHNSVQVTKDIKNSLLSLNSGGTIVLHDCNPPTPWHACIPPPNPINRPWNGDCYKSIIEYRFLNPNVYTAVVDTDWGVGIIEPYLSSTNVLDLDKIQTNNILNNNDIVVGGPLIINNKIITWDFFNLNRVNLLNLISVEQFIKLY